MRVTPIKPRRNGALIAVGVLLMVGFGLIGAVLVGRANNKTAVLAVARPVSVGQVIQAADLEVVKISGGSGLSAIAAANRSTVIGRAAAVSLVPGTLVTRAELTSATTVTKGKVVVSLSLKPGQFPSSLQSGDQVLIIATAQAAEALSPQQGAAPAGAQDPRGVVMVRQATVFGVDKAGANNNGTTTVSVMVDEADAPTLAGAANVGQVTLVLRPEAS